MRLIFAGHVKRVNPFVCRPASYVSTLTGCETPPERREASLKGVPGKCSALLLIVSALFGFSVHGQISPPKSQNIDPTPSEFEVATIKPSTFEPGPRWFRFIDARRWTAF